MGLLQSTQGLLATLLGLARTRLELLSVETQELLARLVLIMVGAVAAILLAALALGFGAVALVMAVGPEHRVAVAGGLAAVFLAAAALIAWRVRREARARPCAARLGELARDAVALEPGDCGRCSLRARGGATGSSRARGRRARGSPPPPPVCGGPLRSRWCSGWAWRWHSPAVRRDCVPGWCAPG
jgi:uncharacterized membrane protein YqjE